MAPRIRHSKDTKVAETPRIRSNGRPSSLSSFIQQTSPLKDAWQSLAGQACPGLVTLLLECQGCQLLTDLSHLLSRPTSAISQLNTTIRLPTAMPLAPYASKTLAPAPTDVSAFLLTACKSASWTGRSRNVPVSSGGVSKSRAILHKKGWQRMRHKDQTSTRTCGAYSFGLLKGYPRG